MITPEEIVERCRRQYSSFLQFWLRGEEANYFPLKIPVGKLPGDYLSLKKEVERLLKASKTPQGYGYSVKTQARATRNYGTQSLPTEILVESQSDFLRLIQKENEFEAFQQDVGLIRSQLAALEPWLLLHPTLVIEYRGVWSGLLEVCRYFLSHPRPGLYLRELPLALDTKFVEQYKGILRQLLDFLLPPEAVDLVQSHFERRFGLRYDEPLVRLRVLDGQFARLYSLPLSDLSLTLSEFVKLPKPASKVLIVENKMTFLTLPPLPDTLAIFGKGFQVELLRSVKWLGDCQIFYWGDLDAQGFQILSVLRTSYPQVESVMMDETTLNLFKVSCVKGTACNVSELPQLTASEQSLFSYLAWHTIRLEQERISQDYSVSCLERIINLA